MYPWYKMISMSLRELRYSHKFILMLVFVLLLAQWFVSAHVHIKHTPDSLCVACLFVKHLDNALGNHTVAIQPQRFTHIKFSVSHDLEYKQAPGVFHSRAPPVLT